MQATSPFALHNSSKRTALVPLTVQHSVLVRKTQLHFSYYLLVLRTSCRQSRGEACEAFHSLWALLTFLLGRFRIWTLSPLHITP